MDLTQRKKAVDAFLQSNRIVARSAWGAAASKIPDTDASLDWDYRVVVIHHSGLSGETDPIVIQRKHLNKNWDDVGYHFMVGPAGQVYEGRRLIYKGSHVELANTGKIGILVMGNFEKALFGLLGKSPSETQMASVKRLIVALKILFPTLTTLGAHKDYKKTECPGSEMVPLLPELRRFVGLSGP